MKQLEKDLTWKSNKSFLTENKNKSKTNKVNQEPIQKKLNLKCFSSMNSNLTTTIYLIGPITTHLDPY